MSNIYNKLYKDKHKESGQNLKHLESIENEEKKLKINNAVVKARKYMALLKIKDALPKLIGREYSEDTVRDGYGLCILQNYLSIVNKKLHELQIRNLKLFKVVSRLKSVIDMIDGDNSNLNNKLMMIGEEFPEFMSALDSIRVLIDDEHVLKEEETPEYKYPDSLPSNYLLTKKIKECIAVRRKIMLDASNENTQDLPEEELSQKEDKLMDYCKNDDQVEYNSTCFLIDNAELHKNASLETSSKDQPPQFVEKSFEKRNDPIIKYLLITVIKNNLGNNIENVENELMKLESTLEFKNNLILEFDDVDGNRVQNTLNELRDKIINFNESKEHRLYRKKPASVIAGKDCVTSKRFQFEKEKRFRSSETDMHDVVGKFRKKKVHTENEIDVFVESKPYKQLIDKIFGKRGRLDRKVNTRRRRDSDLVKVITKKLTEVEGGDSKFELEELEEMRNEELVDLLSTIVVGKQDRLDIDSQTSLLQKNVRFQISAKDVISHTSSKSIKSLQSTISSRFRLEEKPSDAVSRDSFLESGPTEKRPRASSNEEMLSHLGIYDDANKYKFFKPDSINEKVPAPTTFLRPAKYSDLNDLQRLVNNRTLEMFGEKSLSFYFEHSNACIVQLAKDNTLVAFIAIQNDPSLPALPPSSWDIWIHDLYGEQDNIDIMPELDKVAPELSRTFGDYLISELVRFSTGDRIGLTAFINENIVGYALLNSNICISELNKYFEVAPFNGFYVHHKEDYFPVGRKVKMIELNYPKLPEKIDNLSIHSMRAPSGEISMQSSSSYVDSDTEFYESSSSDVVMAEITVPQSFLFTSEFAKRRPTRLISKNELNFQASDKLKINLKPRVSQDILSQPLMLRKDLLHMEIQISNPPPIRMNYEIAEEAVYHGEPNAVMIEIFLMLEGVDFRLSYDFLEAIFEVINVDYCILSFPTSDPIPPVVDHFTKLTPKIGTWFPHEVYALHRSHILSAKFVRSANRTDFYAIIQLTSKLLNYKKIRDDFLDSLFTANSSFESYVLLCSDTIVGLCIIDKTPMALMKLEVQFNIEKYMGPSMYKNHANIKHCCIHPIFSTCSTIFFREVIRLSSVFCLFYRLYEEDIINSAESSAPTIMSCIGDLVPVIPRQPLQYSNMITTNSSSDPNSANSGFFCSTVDSEDKNKSEKFALFFMNTKVGSLVKRCNHLKIVIVGASGTALSFIESLIFRTDLEVMYTNIVLVSPNGLPCRQKPHAARDAMAIFNGRYNRDFMTQLGMNAWINISYGFMTSIDRNKKFITINYDKKINYDYLFLFTGQQFMKPIFHTFDEKYEMRSAFFAGNERLSSSYVSEYPLNMFLINSDVDASNSLLTVQKLLRNTRISYKAMIVVYGHMLEAFAVLNALTMFGIPTNRIAFVEPFPNEPAETLFNDTAIDEAVLATLVKEGFTVHSRFYLTNWEFDVTENLVKKLYFQSFNVVISIECLCLYSFDFKSTDLRTFIALMNSQLVYDGKLVIDNEFRTNDKYIYAAGPLTRYSGSYYSDHMDHEYFNSIEIGIQVYKSVNHLLDRKAGIDGQDDHRRHDYEESPFFPHSIGLPHLFRPRIVSCQLPGGWNYLRIIKPGKVLPLENQLTNKHLKGPTFVTGNCTDETGPGYFKLRLDHNKIVIEVVCYTRQEIEIYNLIKLYGKHVAFFNNLEQRYNLGTVNDLYDYFRQPWAYAMYHDMFYFVEKINRRLFYKTKPNIESKKIFSDIITDSLIDNQWQDLSVSTIEDLRKLLYNNTNLSEEARAKLKSFLLANELYLPMYINDEYITVKKDEIAKHHLHSAPPLGVTPKSILLLSEVLKNIPEGVTMQEFQKQYFNSLNATEDKSVNTEEQGFCITSYLSLHSGADTCVSCEQYRKQKSTSSLEKERIVSENCIPDPSGKSATKIVNSHDSMFGSEKLFKDEKCVIETEQNLCFTNIESKSKDNILPQVSASTEILREERPHESNLSLNASIRNKSFSETKFEGKLDDGTRSIAHSDLHITSYSHGNSSKIKIEDEFDSKTPLKTHLESATIIQSSTSVDNAHVSSSKLKTDSKMSQEYSDKKTDYQHKLPDSSQSPTFVDNAHVTSSKLKTDSKMSQEYSYEKTDDHEKLPYLSKTDLIEENKSLQVLKSNTEMDGNQSSTKVPNVHQTSPSEKPSSSDLKSKSGVKNEITDSRTTLSKKFSSSNTPVDEGTTMELKDGSRKKVDESKTQVSPHTVSTLKESDLKKGQKISNELTGSQTDRLHAFLHSNSPVNLMRESSKQEEINKDVLPQLEHQENSVEVRKYDSISQSSFGPLLLDDLLDHITKVQNLDITSFEDVHNVRWKKVPAEHNVTGKILSGNAARTQDVGTSTPKIASERMRTFSQRCDKSTSCKKDKEEVLKCPGKDKKQLRTKNKQFITDTS